MIKILPGISISEADVRIQAIRAQGPGGQNVNKVSSAVHIRFDIRASGLPHAHKEKLLAFNDRRITRDGTIVIKAQTFRSREKNREDGLSRLAALIRSAVKETKKRRPTRPTRASKERRLASKARAKKTKALRQKITY